MSFCPVHEAGLRRPGYQALLAGAWDGGFDVVLAKALDRLSCGQEDVAGLYKRLRFTVIRIVILLERSLSCTSVLRAP